ncbi:type IV pilin-like G/H family protein [Geitlerinema sp. PCC 9228]|jgi:hypothetical protein|uniref:type IV pilin-like G/H family protein n=1 Tax=Geitlerinema sp. PCC 9228 TaxID=111611 RepID=UPI0008F9BBB8|nr:type IV pilin-like G/H family protein [Geitlerinema sp. PCC 9228]
MPTFVRPKFRNQLRQWGIYSLCGGLLVALPAATLANANTVAATPVLAQADALTDSRQVAEQLYGRWEATNSANNGMTLIFTKVGQFYIILQESDPIALKFGYTINPTPDPMELNVRVGEGETVETIFDLTPDGQLIVQLAGTNPGQPRPTSFDPNATKFRKVSQEMSLPPDVSIYNSEGPTHKTRQMEGKEYLRSLSRAQKAYHIDNNRFATEMNALPVDVPQTTENYRYEIAGSNHPEEQIVMTATAQQEDLKSYTAAIFVITDESGLTSSVAGICATPEASQTPPPPPEAPTNVAGDIQCGGNSQLVELPNPE